MPNEPPVDDGKPAGFTAAFNAMTRALFRYGSLVILMFMVLLIGFDAILRYSIGKPIYGAYDIVGLGLLLSVLVALPDSFRSDCHVRMDIVYDRYGPRMRRAVKVLGAIGALVFGALIIYQSFFYIPRFINTQASTVTLQIRQWPFTVLMLVSAALFCVSILVNAASRRKG